MSRKYFYINSELPCFYFSHLHSRLGGKGDILLINGASLLQPPASSTIFFPPSLHLWQDTPPDAPSP